jgi:hypothetical protein
MPTFPDFIVAGVAFFVRHGYEITWFWTKALLAAVVILGGGYLVLAVLAIAPVAVVTVARRFTASCRPTRSSGSCTP